MTLVQVHVTFYFGSAKSLIIAHNNVFSPFQLVKLQITHYKNAAAQMESMLPSIEKRMSKSIWHW